MNTVTLRRAWSTEVGSSLTAVSFYRKMGYEFKNGGHISSKKSCSTNYFVPQLLLITCAYILLLTVSMHHLCSKDIRQSQYHVPSFQRS